jgi:hypothetical protein
MTGSVQFTSVAVTLPAGYTYFSMQKNIFGFGSGGYGQGGYGYGQSPEMYSYMPNGAPVGVIAALRMRAPYPIRKVTLKGLDDINPGWQQANPSTQPIAWFPLGVSGFGIYPQLIADTTVMMDFICSPVNQFRPYDGNVPVPFESEFADAFSQYAACMLRTKEGGTEAEEAEVVYNEYLLQMKQLSAYQNRLDSLVLTEAYGGRLKANPRTVV